MKVKPDGWISHDNVRKITRLIDQQIVLRTEQLFTMTKLKHAIAARNVQGKLRQSDLAFIKRTLKGMR